MAVYVDDMEAEFEGMVMCHMIADTHLELLAMAKTIGVKLQWIQKIGTAGEHFDIAKHKRALAVRAGALSIGVRELSEKCQARRGEDGRAAYYAGTTPPQGLPFA